MVNAKSRNNAQPFSRLMDGPRMVTPTSDDLGGQLVEEPGQVFDVADPATRP